MITNSNNYNVIVAASTLVMALSAQCFSQITFDAPVSYPNTNWPFDVVALDIDLDGDLDLAFTLRGSNLVRTMFNLGDGSFVSGTSFAVGSAPTGLAVGDFNSDGYPDLANSNFGSGIVTVLINAGDGSFLPMIGYSVGSLPHGVYVADFDLDGQEDLVCCNAGSGTITIRYGDGAGGFSTRQDMATGSQPHELDLGDIDNDGDIDLVVMNFLSGTVTIVRNDGGRNYTITANHTLGGGNQSLRVKAFDTDNDGDLDVLAKGGYYENDGTGVFTRLSRFAPAPEARADFDLDGAIDLLQDPGRAEIDVYLNDGSGVFSHVLILPVSDRLRGIVTADLDNDGDPDIAACNGPWLGGAGGNVAVFMNNTIPPCDIDPTDCNGNGVPDACEIADGSSADCNANGIPDECEISDGSASDCDGNGIIDICEYDAIIDSLAFPYDVLDTFLSYPLFAFPGCPWNEARSAPITTLLLSEPAADVDGVINSDGQADLALMLAESSTQSLRGAYRAVGNAEIYIVRTLIRIDQFSDAPLGVDDDAAAAVGLGEFDTLTSPDAWEGFLVYASAFTGTWRLKAAPVGEPILDIDLGAAALTGQWYEIWIDFDAVRGDVRVRIWKRSPGSLIRVVDHTVTFAGWSAIETELNTIRLLGWEGGSSTIAARAAVDEIEVLSTPFRPGDVDRNGLVNVTDLLALLAAWGPCEGCLEDSNGDGLVNVTDLLNLLANWG